MNTQLEKEIESLPVSELQQYDGPQISGDNVIFLVSEKDPSTTTGYISKNLAFEDLTQQLVPAMGVDYLSTGLFSAQSDFKTWAAFKEHWLSTYATLQCNTDQPYILSAIQLKEGMVAAVSGFFLSAGMERVFAQTKLELVQATTGNFKNLNTTNFTLDGHTLTYEQLIKDQFLSAVNIISDKMVFTFKIENEEPNTVSVEMSSFAGNVSMRDWTV